MVLEGRIIPCVQDDSLFDGEGEADGEHFDELCH